MTNEENIALTRRKHLYVIDHTNGTLNVNKRAVAYINKQYAYYIVPGCAQLREIALCDVREEPRLDDPYFTSIVAYPNLLRYFWRIPEGFNVRDSKTINAARLNDLEQQAERMYKTYRIYATDAESKLKKYHEIQEQIRNIKNRMKEEDG